jgi:hypothetical protein
MRKIHFATRTALGYLRVACGVPDTDRFTSNPARVTCKRCRAIKGLS